MDCRDLKKLFTKIERNVEELSGNILFFFHFTFHDLRHCKNMYEYLEVLRNSVRLEYPELWSLRMAIYLHDTGMLINPRYWHKLGIPKDVLSPPGKDLIAELVEDVIVEEFLGGKGFDDTFFDENGCLRLPTALKEKPWDEFSLVEKATMRAVMRKFHPQIGDWAARKRFIGEHPIECRKIGEMIGGMVRLHEGKDGERVKNLGLWEIAESPVSIDQRKITALLILLDSLDCAGQSRASPGTLDEIIDEVRMIEEKEIEIEAKRGGEKREGYLPHWVFKKYIKEIAIYPNQIKIVTETSNPSYLAGILFFEIAKNVWPKYALASDILKDYGFYSNLIVQMPSQTYGELLIDEDLMRLGKEFSETVVDSSELPPQLAEKYKIGKLRLPRMLALLLGYGGMYNEYANQLAKKHVCRLLAKLGGEQRSQLEQIFRCD
ncbi:MAG: hypothetical protein QXM02_05625 [Thermoproteota archaeon]